MSFIETSALDSTNVEKAFVNLIKGNEKFSFVKKGVKICGFILFSKNVALLRRIFRLQPV